MSTITRKGFVKFSLNGRCGNKMQFTCVTCTRKPSDVLSRRNDPTMSTIIRQGSVKFCLDGHCGEKVMFVKAWVISQTKPSGTFDNVARTGPQESVTFSKIGKPRRKAYANRTCACGDIYCNHISKFLGTMITEKCSYQNPDQCNKHPNKQLRCEKIYHQLVTYRKTRNDLFKTPVSEVPPKCGRFNEIHYSMSFLMRAVKRSKRRIPESMDIVVAKETNMFREDLVCYYKHYRYERVVVVPTLNAHQAIQV